MKAKRSIAIPKYLDQWLKKLSTEQGQSVSALISHLLQGAKEQLDADRKS